MSKIKYLLHILPNILWPITFIYGVKVGLPLMGTLLSFYTILLCIHLLYSTIDFVFVRASLSRRLTRSDTFKNVPIKISGLNIGCSIGLMVVSVFGYYSAEASIMLFALGLVSLVVFIYCSIRYKSY